MITATASGCSLRDSSSTCRPSMPGIFRSTRRSDQRSFLIRARAVSPSGAVARVYPSFSSQADNDSRTISSSSTMRIRVRSLLMVFVSLLSDLGVAALAVVAECRVLGVHVQQVDRPRHDARGQRAVQKAERVPELVNAFLHQSSGEKVEILTKPAVWQEPRGGHDGGRSAELCLAIDERENRDEQVDVRDPDHLGGVLRAAVDQPLQDARRGVLLATPVERVGGAVAPEPGAGRDVEHLLGLPMQGAEQIVICRRVADPPQANVHAAPFSSAGQAAPKTDSRAPTETCFNRSDLSPGRCLYDLRRAAAWQRGR